MNSASDKICNVSDLVNSSRGAKKDKAEKKSKKKKKRSLVDKAKDVVLGE